jgi:serine/threonine protein kinase
VGSGGAATVYLARQSDLDRFVALKELHGLRDVSVTRRFLREARVAASLMHPNIVTVHEYFEFEGVAYIAMEYIARGSLRPFMQQLAPERIGRVLEDVLAGLAHAERHGVVHRDIKPENLLVTDEGGVKIADFGIAKATSVVGQSTVTAAGLTVGTPSYMAPEQAMAREVGPWTDLYAVGVTAFEMLVGRTPFAETTEPMAIVLRQVNDAVPRVADIAPGVPVVLSDWVGWLLAKEPSARPQSATHAWDALEEALISLLGPRWRRGSDVRLVDERTTRRQSARMAATIPPGGTATPSGRRRRRRLPSILALVGATAALAAVAVTVVGGGSHPGPTLEPVSTRPATTTPTSVRVERPSTTATGSSPTTTRHGTLPLPEATATQARRAPREPSAPAAKTSPPPPESRSTVATAPPPQSRVATTTVDPNNCAGDSTSDDPSDDACSDGPP